MTQLIVQETLLRLGVRRFENRVNALLSKGWKLEDWGHGEVGFLRLRMFLWAKLTKED